MLLGITVVVFVLINLMPGDPAAMQADSQDPKVSARIYEMMVKQFELDRPIHERYLRWLGRMVQGDFGESFADGQPIGPKVRERLPNTMYVSALAVILGLLAAVPICILQAVRHNGWFDRISGVLLYALFAIPSYVMAVVLVYFVGVKWDLLPFRGMTSDGFAGFDLADKAKDIAAHFTLITFCFTYTSIAFDSRFVRGNLLEVLRQDYVRTARAKGLSEWAVVMKHAMRNTMIPLLTRLGLLVPALISGSVILEVIFTWPGLGRLFYDGIMARDYPVMMCSIVITSSLVLAGTLIADLLYGWADPRISHD